MTPPLRLTNSEMKSWRRCPRQWYFSYHLAQKLKAEPVAGRPTTLGTRVHDALAHLYDPAIENPDPLAFLAGGFDRDLEAFPAEEKRLREELDMAEAMLEGYLGWLEETGMDQDLVVEATETKIEVPLGQTGVNLLSKLDARVRRLSTNARLALEHKTVSSLQESPTLALDTQLLTEHLAEFLDLKEKGEDAESLRADGVLYNMLRKVKRTARAKPPFYGRIEIHHNTDELRNHWYHVLAAAQAIQTAHVKLNAGANHHVVCPPNPKRDCSWDCPFLEPCKMMNRNEDWRAYLEEFYETHDPLERYFQVVGLGEETE